MTVSYVRTSHVWQLCCSHRSLGVVDDELEAMSAANFLAGEIGGESQFEGITYV